MHEPKNRVATALPVLDLWVDHAGGSYKTCPNGMVACAIWVHSGERPDLPASYLRPGSEIFDLTVLKPISGKASAISGHPAVVYRSDDLEIPLAPDELYRMASRSLRPDEYFTLRARYGLFHEIHDDFYSEADGEAWQPMFNDDDEPTPDEDTDGLEPTGG